MNALSPSLAAVRSPPGWVNEAMLALALAVLAGVIRWLFDPLLNDRIPFATFFIAIVVAVRFGGVLSSVLTMLFGLGIALLLWFPDGLQSLETVSSCVVYLLSALAIITLGQQMLSAEALASHRSRELLDTVQGLKASQGRLQLATEVSGIGVFQWDLQRDRFHGENPEAFRIFGREPDQPKLSMAGFIERHLHPDDVDRVQKSLQLAMRPGERFHAVFRNRRDAGDWRWVEVAGRFLFGAGSATPSQLIGVVADITERKQMEDNLRQMAANLSEADHRKDEFLATLAHELRNPLAPIRNGIELLKRGAGDPARAPGVIGVMERQMSHMVRLVDDLLDVSRITRNKLELRCERVELASVINTAVEASRPLLEARGHHLRLQLPPVPVHLQADPTRLVQVFVNLLNNAAKYTEPGGEISVVAGRQGGEIAVLVQDNGKGIPAPLLPRVFDMFTQVDRTLERTHGGLGIGLSMVRRLVELHGGRVQLASDGPGRGTRATVILPTVHSPAPSPVQRSPHAAAPATGRRVLVVDDNIDAAESLASVMRLLGNEVRVGHDGVEGVELAASFLPEVVMLDIGMPRLNGYEACRQIREQPATRDALIVAVTGWGQDEDRRRSEQAGFDLHLTKPVDLEAVEALLARMPAPRRPH